MYLLISSTADNITQLIPAVTSLSSFFQLHASENVLEASPSWPACHHTEHTNILRYAYRVHLRLVWISEQTAITSLHSSNWFTDKISLFGLCTSSKLKKQVLLPYSDKEAPNLVDTLDESHSQSLCTTETLNLFRCAPAFMASCLL